MDPAVRGAHRGRETSDLAGPEVGPAAVGERIRAPGLDAQQFELALRRGPNGLDLIDDEAARLGRRQRVEPLGRVSRGRLPTHPD